MRAHGRDLRLLDGPRMGMTADGRRWPQMGRGGISQRRRDAEGERNYGTRETRERGTPARDSVTREVPGTVVFWFRAFCVFRSCLRSGPIRLGHERPTGGRGIDHGLHGLHRWRTDGRNYERRGTRGRGSRSESLAAMRAHLRDLRLLAGPRMGMTADGRRWPQMGRGGLSRGDRVRSTFFIFGSTCAEGMAPEYAGDGGEGTTKGAEHAKGESGPRRA